MVLCAISHPNAWNNIIWCHFCPFQALIQGSRGPKYGYFWVKIRPLWRAVSRSYRPAWKVSGATYYTPMHVTTLLRATFALSRHPSRVPGVRNMSILVVKIWPLWRAGSRVKIPPGNGFMCHITPQCMEQHYLGPFLPSPGTHPGFQGSKNGYF